MLTYKEVVARFREKNSKQPEATWTYQPRLASFDQGGRVGYQAGQLVQPGPGRPGYGGKGFPMKVTEEKLAAFDNYIKNTDLSLKEIGEKPEFGYKKTKPGQGGQLRNRSPLMKEYEKIYGKIPEERFKPFKFTKDSSKVKRVIDLFESGMTKSAIEFKTGISRKEIRNIFHKFAPEYIGDANLPSGEGRWAVQRRRKKIIKELTDYWKDQPGGKKILEEMNQKLRDIKLKNAEIANMSDKAILNNEKFKEAMNLNVKGLKAGEGINFKRYANLSDAEYVAKVRGLAATNQFFQPEHFIAINKKNPASMNPKNIYTAVGKMGGQMEVMKNFMASNPNDKRVSEITKLFKSQNMMDSKGLLGEGFSKLATKTPKTASALTTIKNFAFNPVEMGLLPLALAGEGLYQNYKDKKDLKRALEQTDMSQEQKDAILEGFRQEARDRGDVGLETWAINEPNVEDQLKEQYKGMEGKIKLTQDARKGINFIRQQDAEAKKIEKQRIEDAYKKQISRNINITKRPIEFKEDE